MEEDTYGPPGGPVQVAIAISGLQQHIALLRNSMEMLCKDIHRLADRLATRAIKPSANRIKDEEMGLLSESSVD